ncbi:MAG TPA: N-acetylmuramic acid 6-phosphate etherase [Limnochordia bacterium]
MGERFERLTTEARSAYHDLDARSTVAILEAINAEDQRVPAAVGREIPHIAAAVDAIADRMARGGRLIYVGAGTSGRLGVLDASECPPTFSVSPELVQGVIAGGPPALTTSIEGAEDDPDAGARDLEARGVTAADAVVGVAASGRTPYVLGAIRWARQAGALTVGLACNAHSELAREVEIMICPIVGPEVLSGSTRMKAGTAQKLVLNMISTTVMIRLGKVYSNLMVDIDPKNEKLIDRAQRIVRLATGCSREEARAALSATGWRPKVAIVMLLTKRSAAEAEKLLARAGGFVREALRLAGESDAAP